MIKKKPTTLVKTQLERIFPLRSLEKSFRSRIWNKSVFEPYVVVGFSLIEKFKIKNLKTK